MQKYAWNSCKNAILEFKWAFRTFWSQIVFQVHHPFKRHLILRGFAQLLMRTIILNNCAKKNIRCLESNGKICSWIYWFPTFLYYKDNHSCTILVCMLSCTVALWGYCRPAYKQPNPIMYCTVVLSTTLVPQYISIWDQR